MNDAKVLNESDNRPMSRLSRPNAETLKRTERTSQRKTLPHAVPNWVDAGSLFFITICCAQRNVNSLCEPRISAAIFESATHRQQRGDWFMRLLVLMPDHLHALLAFPADRQMESVIRGWKSYLARLHGIRWQRDFFDHRVRNDESWEEKAHYVRQNPVRAGLVRNASEWPYMWEA